MTDLHLCPADASDADAAAEIEKDTFPDPWGAEELRSHFSSPLSLSLVAVSEGRTAGILVGNLIPPEGELYRIAVRADCRRLGIGRALIKEAIARGRERGMTVFYLEVRASNAPAVSLYESLGFRKTGERKNYYKSPTEDAYLYSLYLNEGNHE